MKIYPGAKIELNELMEVDKKIAENFYKKDLVKIVYLTSMS